MNGSEWPEVDDLRFQDFLDLTTYFGTDESFRT